MTNYSDITNQIIRGLAVARKMTKKTNREVCRDAGISELTYRRFINHRTDILLHNLDKLCRAYGMTINKVIALGDDTAS